MPDGVVDICRQIRENYTNGPAAENVGETLRSVEDYRLMHQAVELAEKFVDFV
ncbi:hypothetical protein J2793_000808 [Paraburkholderia caledonica]|uniref:Uncharacterized protein n=1 Tax=Paraburkholderia caledonica TaxID=134536 RepID=A0AB73I687_9BURK|nr:hypothetical protein [Paraburkholderia caledonica]